jgi:hypothetical protein
MEMKSGPEVAADDLDAEEGNWSQALRRRSLTGQKS